MTSGWTCSGCGNSGGAEPIEGHTQLDTRYTLGHCKVCTPWPKPKPHPVKKGKHVQPPRKVIQLVRSDAFDRAAFDHRQLVQRQRQLVKRLDAKTSSKFSPAQLKEAQRAVAWLMRDDADEAQP